MCSMNTRKSIFFSQTSVRIQLNDTKGVKSDWKIGNRRWLRRSQGDLSFSELLARVQLYKQLGYNTYLKLLRLPLLGGQPSRLTNSFVEYYRFDSLMSQLFKSLGYKTYLKLLLLLLSSGHPFRLIKSFVRRLLSNQLFLIQTTIILHNLFYVILFFVICFTDGIFDAFNGWNHCIF